MGKFAWCAVGSHEHEILTPNPLTNTTSGVQAVKGATLVLCAGMTSVGRSSVKGVSPAVRGLGLRVEGLGFRVQGPGFRVEG